tara:strand:+ start:138 stop:848 length:711 start_codon:yes stop_codon:yes gene_type:complete
MQSHPLPYSLGHLKELQNSLPPFFPEEDKKALRHAIDHLEHDANASADQAEQTLLVFGRKIWPYARAFGEFLTRVEKERAHEFLDAHIKTHPELYDWYKGYEYRNGNGYELFTGAHKYLEPLSVQDRAALCQILAEVKRDLRDATAVLVAGPERETYQRRVLEFTLVQEAVDERLERLRALADEEQNHPQLAEELRANIAGFEHGLALLGPHTSFEAVCSERERYHGRKAELSGLA